MFYRSKLSCFQGPLKISLDLVNGRIKIFLIKNLKHFNNFTWNPFAKKNFGPEHINVATSLAYDTEKSCTTRSILFRGTFFLRKSDDVKSAFVKSKVKQRFFKLDSSL